MKVVHLSHQTHLKTDTKEDISDSHIILFYLFPSFMNYLSFWLRLTDFKVETILKAKGKVLKFKTRFDVILSFYFG